MNDKEIIKGREENIEHIEIEMVAHETGGERTARASRASCTESREARVGDVLVTSWGYNTTINDYCKVLENTGKTLKCVMIARRVENDDGMGGGRSIPLPESEISDPFRIRIIKQENCTTLVGSYPFVEGKDEKRKGYWYLWDGKPDYYNTWD